jgi:hypothetical protein
MRKRERSLSCNNHAPCSVCFTHPLGIFFFLSPSQLSIWWSAFSLSFYIEIQRRKGWWCSQLFRRSSLRNYSQYSTQHLFLCDVIQQHADDTLITLQKCWGIFLPLSRVCCPTQTGKHVDSRSLSTRRHRSFTNGVLGLRILIIISLSSIICYSPYYYTVG